MLSRLSTLARSEEGEVFLHQIFNLSTGQELTRLVSRWQARRQDR